MREQICSPGLFDLDELKSRVKMPSLSKFGIVDPGLCVCEYHLWFVSKQFITSITWLTSLPDYSILRGIFIHCTCILNSIVKNIKSLQKKAQCLLHRMFPEELVPGRIRTYFKIICKTFTNYFKRIFISVYSITFILYFKTYRNTKL
jgi:hypothetical protein